MHFGLIALNNCFKVTISCFIWRSLLCHWFVLPPVYLLIRERLKSSLSIRLFFGSITHFLAKAGALTSRDSKFERYVDGRSVVHVTVSFGWLAVVAGIGTKGEVKMPEQLPREVDVTVETKTIFLGDTVINILCGTDL